jgi:hypothetical protein
MGMKNNDRPVTVPPIGAMLLAEEYIVPQDLDFALEHQKYSKGLIGEILIRMGAVEPTELDRVLCIQKKMSVK